MSLRNFGKTALRFLTMVALATPQPSLAFFNVLMLKNTRVNLEVPIELIDTGLDSNTTSVTFEGTRTSLDTTDYDGTVTYSFEVVAESSDSVARTVNLLDSSNTVKASISVPAGTVWKRFRTTFTPTAGASNYRIQMPATTAISDCNIRVARILVNQVGATKTKLYYPLLSDRYQNSNAADMQIDGGTGPSWYISNLVGIRWLKDTNNLATIASGNAWTLEAVMATANAVGTARVALAQAGTTTLVTGSTVTTTSTTPTLLSVSFANNATNFTDNAEFQVKVYNTDAATDALIYKAGIWVKLTNLSKGYVAYRVARGSTDTTTTTVQYTEQQRTLLNTAAFSKPTLYFEDMSKCSIASCGTLSLYSNGTNDTGTTSPTLVASSTNTPGLAYSRTRSAAISVTSGNRYYAGYTRASGTYNLTNAFVIVTFGR